MMYGEMTLFWSVIAFPSDDNKWCSNRNLASVINNWNNSSKCLWTSKVIQAIIFAWSNELLIRFKIKISDNCLNFEG